MSLVMKTAMNILEVVITYSDLLEWTFCYLLLITLLLNYTKKDNAIETQVTGDISSSAYRSAPLKNLPQVKALHQKLRKPGH